MLERIRMFAAGVAAIASIGAHGAPINLVDYGTIGAAGLITFEGAGSAIPGTNYDGILTLTGASFSERFAGQIVTNATTDSPDVLSGSPTDPLRLVTGQPNRNVVVVLDGDVQSEVLAGLGPLEHPNAEAIGEGAFAVRFDTAQAEFGFQLVGGANQGGATIAFFRGDGSLIDEIVLGPLPLSAFFGFSRDGGISDIAGFSVFNDDLGGIGLDNLKFTPRNGQPISEPSTIAMLALGIAAFVARRRS